MTTSSPAVPSSFDPAIHLHSEDPAIDLPSESFSDELEALNLQRLEKTRNKVVIQHRAWDLSDVFRSDEDIAPSMESPVSKDVPCSCEIQTLQRDLVGTTKERFRQPRQLRKCHSFHHQLPFHRVLLRQRSIKRGKMMTECQAHSRRSRRSVRR